MIGAQLTLGAVLRGNTRDLKEAARIAIYSVALTWRERYLPLHYTHRGATKYDYVKRQGERGSGRHFPGSYSEKKLKAKGHTYPQVWSGKTRAAAMRGTITTVDANITFTARLKLPAIYDFFGLRQFRRPRTRAKWAVKGPKPLFTEVSTITADEIADLSRAGSQTLIHQLERLENTRQKTSFILAR